MSRKTSIPWAWLKETPPGSKGLIPGVGLRYIHQPKTWQFVERIFVDVGTVDGTPAMLSISRDPSCKSGWNRPLLVMRKADDFTIKN